MTYENVTGDIKVHRKKATISQFYDGRTKTKQTSSENIFCIRKRFLVDATTTKTTSWCLYALFMS